MRPSPRFCNSSSMAESPQKRRARLRIDSTRQRERALHEGGIAVIAGVDEAGIGPLAGPVVAAAVILPEDFDTGLVEDSKKLSTRQRERSLIQIRALAIDIAVAIVEPPEIDSLNIHHAGLAAMRRAVAQLVPRAEHALVDGHRIPDLGCGQTRIVGGDACEASIAAASIVAKVTRDAIMVEFDRAYPDYGFAGHKGYPTAFHRAALEKLGPSPIHRMSYPAVLALIGRFSPRYDALMEAAQSVKDESALKSWRARMRRERHALSEPEVKRLRSFMSRQMTRNTKS